MQQQPEREREPCRAPQTTPGSRPLVLGMSTNLSFASGGLVTVNVMISQGSSPDESGGFAMSATQTIGAEDVTPLALSGDGSYTAGQALTVQLVVNPDGTPRTLATTLAAGVVVEGTQPAFVLQNPNGTETLDGSVHLGTGGEASISLDLSSNPDLGSGAIQFTLSCGPTSAVGLTDVTYLQGRSGYTAGEAYLFEVAYIDDNDDPQSYSLRVPAEYVVPGGYYTQPMTKN